MKRFIEGEDRHQVTLLPECLDDFIAEDNTVRIVDVFWASMARARPQRDARRITRRCC
jgi:transposase